MVFVVAVGCGTGKCFLEACVEGFLLRLIELVLVTVFSTEEDAFPAALVEVDYISKKNELV